LRPRRGETHKEDGRQPRHENGRHPKREDDDGRTRRKAADQGATGMRKK